MGALVVAPSFQFHKGTIKTQRPREIGHLLHRFQFHKGTIKTGYLYFARQNLPNFNSIKVRLKQISSQESVER